MLKNYWRYFIGTLLAIVLLWGVQRMIFRWAVQKSIMHLENKLKVNVNIGQYGIEGLNGAFFKNVLISYPEGDTLFWSNAMHVRLKILPLLTGKIQLSKFQADSMLAVYKHGFLQQTADTLHTDSFYAKQHTPLSYRLRMLFKKLPATCRISTATFRYYDTSQWLSMRIDSFTIKNKLLEGVILLSDSTSQQSFAFQGKFIPGKYFLAVTIRPLKSIDNTFPWLTQKWGANLSAKSAFFECQLPSASSILFTISAGEFSVSHPKLAEQPVQFDTTSLSLIIKTEKEYWQIDSSSRVNFNGFEFPLFVRYEYDANNPMLEFAIPALKFSAQQFFESLPKGAFRRIAGVKAEGDLSFVLRGRIPFRQLDSIYLYSNLQPFNFRIKQYGTAYLPMLNDTFTIYRHEPGFSPVAIHVDSTSPNYTHLRDIPPHLIYAVLTSEDGSFFYHKGFNEEAFAKSLAENIRKKRFARGASTISMQLVRNVFLSKNKTLSRKFEEMLLTWMLENSHVVSKQRMLEVYFNIIEWGPNIYGIKQAAKFYFDKKPSQLTLQESIFLAAIIPSPKYFRYTFQTNGMMKDGFEAYFQRVAQIMLARNQIQPTDTIGLNHKVTLTGTAQKFLAEPMDSLIVNPSDTIFIDPEENF